MTQKEAKELVRSRLLNEGADPVRLAPAAFGAALAGELALWRDVAGKPGMELR